MRFATHLELLTHHLQEAGLNLAGRERLAAALERAGWSLTVAAAAVGGGAGSRGCRHHPGGAEVRRRLR
ncbi:hypothetical protein [Nonomuraea pusilla]|uniref:Uncharacterized protein n=1 Tax=Nonomuraea pusilla TaxID=46177 RepID=A0A1H8IH15_9ACTN|nr:hypothetical protein [Nonomuraea pusilla]SEN67546.1 hypothetical protein SAMN05660976_08050 [Nonomuraea pusilla]